MGLRNGILIRIRKKHIRIGNKFDCVEGVRASPHLSNSAWQISSPPRAKDTIVINHEPGLSKWCYRCMGGALYYLHLVAGPGVPTSMIAPMWVFMRSNTYTWQFRTLFVGSYIHDEYLCIIANYYGMTPFKTNCLRFTLYHALSYIYNWSQAIVELLLWANRITPSMSLCLNTLTVV